MPKRTRLINKLVFKQYHVFNVRLARIGDLVALGSQTSVTRFRRSKNLRYQGHLLKVFEGCEK